MKKVGGQYLEGIREELDLYVKIRTTIAGIASCAASIALRMRRSGTPRGRLSAGSPPSAPPVPKTHFLYASAVGDRPYSTTPCALI
jgi:hypothetical protein